MLELHVFANRSRMPDAKRWNEALAREQPPVRLDPFDPVQHTGFLPATIGTDSAGFEYYLESSAEYFESYQIESMESYDAVASFRLSGRLELASALLAIATLVDLTGGRFFEPQAGEWFDVQWAREQARAVLES
jgi:hypothetical protein